MTSAVPVQSSLWTRPSSSARRKRRANERPAVARRDGYGGVLPRGPVGSWRTFGTTGRAKRRHTG